MHVSFQYRSFTVRAVRRSLAGILALAVTACSTIPPAAPQLSEQLAAQLDSLEQQHQRLAVLFFQTKRQQLDEFVQQQWLPQFAEHYFQDPAVAAIWQQVVASPNLQDRLRFIQLTGPKLQLEIDQKRQRLQAPLAMLEREYLSQLQQQYQQARAINHSLTAFLYSASEVDANRQRYLRKLGVEPADLERYLTQADSAVADLLQNAQTAQQQAEQIDAYIAQLETLLNSLKKAAADKTP